MAGQTIYRITSIFGNYRSLFINRPLIINCPQAATLTRESSIKLKSLPEKPKKPLTAFFRFSQTRREEIRKSNPSMKITEIAKQMSEEWKIYDSTKKEALEEQYKDEMSDYKTKNLIYSSKLTEEERAILKDISDEKRKDREKRLLKKTFKETNKPKRPRGAFIFFLKDKYNKDTGKFKEFLVVAKQLWAELPEVEKQKYNDMFLDDKKRYEIEMGEWETKMIANGRTDLVRRDSLAVTIPKRPIQPKHLTPKSSDKTVTEESTQQSTIKKSGKSKDSE